MNEAERAGTSGAALQAVEDKSVPSLSSTCLRSSG
jgi:hypothetical protein